eukprot:CAMPEP_0179326688 /NCGR_PEP_ID=MMETSP0797-20121207/61559_1 /TAXON_ID=47934 /ORGANISM="Dinophysis acuminata, Strain DAEP01" /LENGTH=162 /DNA_ID=CAMNT_0021038957 /DNA_START=45 /DNA_END=530 /DNA_ORIENTATION=-
MTWRSGTDRPGVDLQMLPHVKRRPEVEHQVQRPEDRADPLDRQEEARLLHVEGLHREEHDVVDDQGEAEEVPGEPEGPERVDDGDLAAAAAQAALLRVLLVERGLAPAAGGTVHLLHEHLHPPPVLLDGLLLMAPDLPEAELLEQPGRAPPGRDDAVEGVAA